MAIKNIKRLPILSLLILPFLIGWAIYVLEAHKDSKKQDNKTGDQLMQEKGKKLEA
jgi:hypothetical protein